MNKFAINKHDKKEFEKFSSAFTLSDMEIFIFPELFYPLVLANIMSPAIWEWRNNAWFKDIHKKSFTYKINRIKQFIMDNYMFNLDLETWGLTTKEKEIERFKDFVDIDMLSRSNALFGYEGDKYYYDIDIRKHFGLDKFTTNVIPYWKTETVEAMNAFRYKEGFTTGAGECVSLSALYAAALFIVGRVPLEHIFLVATPLHSQNFVDINEGVLTNNRRIVTRNMWFNGTALSTKARRALEHENVTIVSHITGHIHLMYNDASIDTDIYNRFATNLRNFLKTGLSADIFINYLRYDSSYKKCFQYKHLINGKPHYITMEKVFEYEHSSRNNFSEPSRQALMTEIETEEFSLTPFEGRICLNEVENYLKTNQNLGFEEIRKHFLLHAVETSCHSYENIKKLFEGIKDFIEVNPKLPIPDKKFVKNTVLPINIDNSREDIINMITGFAETNEMAKYTMYVYRQMDVIDWQPFIKAAMERNPVAFVAIGNQNIDLIIEKINQMPNESIYDSCRLALPDEVWNYQRGDGIEKAILLANILQLKGIKINKLLINNTHVQLETENGEFKFISGKQLTKEILF